MALLDPALKVVKARPTDNISAYNAYLRGLSYSPFLIQEDARLAVQMFERAVALDPGFALAHAQLSMTHSRLFLKTKALEEVTAARQAMERALELEPDLAESHLARGYYFYRCHLDYEQALLEFSIAAVLLPNDTRVLGDTALIYRRQGLWQDAVSQLTRQLELDPQNHDVAMQLGITYMVLRQYERAEDAYDLSISLNPDQIWAYTGKALSCWLRDGTVDRAEAVLAAVPRQSEITSLDYYCRQRIYRRDYRGALARISALSSDESTSVDFLTSVALRSCFASRMLQDQGYPTICESILKKMQSALAENPNSDLHAAIALVYANLGRKEEALAAAQLAVDRYPVERDAFWGPDYLICQAQVLALVGEHDQAIDLIDHLLSIPCLLSVGLLELDPSWDPLRDNSRFQQLCTKYRVRESR